MDPKRRYWFPVVGYNYRMTNIQAAIGLGQLENIGAQLERRALIAAWYDAALKGLERRSSFPPATWSDAVCWMYTILLRDGGACRRDAVMQLLDDAGIETRPVFHPLHLMPPYRGTVEYPIAEHWAQKGMSLPTHSALDQDDVARIAAALRVALDKS